MLKNIKCINTITYKTVYQLNNKKKRIYQGIGNLNNRIFSTIGR